MAKKECPYCGKMIESRGLKSHMAFCPKRFDSTERGNLPVTEDQIETVVAKHLQELDVRGLISEHVDRLVETILAQEPNNTDVTNLEEVEKKMKEIEKLGEQIREIGSQIEGVGKEVKRIQGMENSITDIKTTIDRTAEAERQLVQHSAGEFTKLREEMARNRRSLDAVNTRTSQLIHRINALEEVIEHSVPEPSNLPEEPQPEKASAKTSDRNLVIGHCKNGRHFFFEGEKVPEECPNCGTPTTHFDSPKHPKQALLDAGRTLLVGQCKKGCTFYEPDDEIPEFCTACGSKTVKYDSPKMIALKGRDK